MKAGIKKKTNPDYWDRVWSDRPVNDPMDPQAPGLNGAVARAWHKLFSDLFMGWQIGHGARIVEVGCGGSTVLPYFAKVFGLDAHGLDYSATGCLLSEAIAQKARVTTEIHCGDVFDVPNGLKDSFDVVYSAGLAEHFFPTEKIVSALGDLARPGGYILTIVPNMHGIVGLSQRLVSPSVYRVHTPLDPNELAEAHRRSGLAVLEAGHFMTANFSVINFESEDKRVPTNIGLRLASWASKSIWLCESFGLPEIRNRLTSPYVLCTARKNVG